MQPTRKAPLRTRTLALLAGLGLLVAACGAAASDPEPDVDVGAESVEEPDIEPEPEATETDVEVEPEVATIEDDRELVHVVATTSILGDIVGQLVGDDADVSVIMPPGADPHAYEPSAQDGAVLREADLVVATGLLLEESLVSVLEAVADEGGNVFELADKLDPIEFEESGDGHDHGHSHGDEDGAEDPHVWFDPIRMADGIKLIATEIAAVDTNLDEAEWMSRADAYVAELMDVHEQMEAMFATIPDGDRVLVTNHDALGYLAYRYDFEVLGTVIPGSSTQADADPRGFAELIEAVEAAGVTAIFAENTDSTVLAEQLASEVIGRSDVQVEVVRIYTDALGEEGSGAETYLGMLMSNAGLITDALG